MKWFCLLLLMSLVSGCHRHNGKKEEFPQGEAGPAPPIFLALNEHFPLTLSKIDLSHGHYTQIPMDDVYGIFKLIDDEDSTSDRFFNAIQISEGDNTFYMFILTNRTGGLYSRIFRKSNQTKKLFPQKINFNIHAMYEIVDSQLRPSNLKLLFKMNSPDLEMVNVAGTRCLKLTRLNHNGTFNAIETTILKWNPDKIDTVEFRQKILQ